MTIYRVKIEDRVYQVSVEAIQDSAAPASKPKEATVKQKQEKGSAAALAGTEVKAPLSGSIISVKKETGQSVDEGEVLLSLEALKMENEISAPVSGKVVQIVATGEAVESGDVLAVIE